RDVHTTVVPALDHVFLIGYSWDKSSIHLTVYDWTSKSLVQSVSSSTNASYLSPWVESDGLYIANREDLSLPYRGRIYGGCFGMGISYNILEMGHEFKQGNPGLGKDFLMHPKVMGVKGTDTIREPHHLDMTVIAPDLDVFWN